MGKGKPYRISGFSDILMAGICVLTVYAQLFSLFYRVSALCTALLAALSLVSLYICRNEIKDDISSFHKLGVLKMIGMALLFLLFAYGTSYGYMHYDSDLYHAQSIRWIEEYGVIKGLGNLHTRLAYNSSAFALSALFSFAFLGRGSFHVCQGLIALLVASKSISVFSKDSFKNPSFGMLPRIVAIYYICNIFDEMVSPASDYFVVLTVLYTVICYSDLCDKKVKDPYPYALLSLLCIIIVSIKISAALITLIVVYPAYLLIKEKDVPGIIKYILTGIAALIPYFARNILLSGYLVYPVPSIDLFDLDYKIPKGLAEYDSIEIQVFGRGHSDVTRYKEPLEDWIFDWFFDLGIVDRASFLLGIVSLAVLVIVIAAAVIKKRNENLAELVLIASIDISFAFFVVTSPNIRYCCVFLYLAPVLTLGFVYFKIVSSQDRAMIYRVALCAFALYRSVTFAFETARSATGEYLVCQQDYGQYEMISYDLHGVTFYFPEHGDRTGYDPFPAAPLKAEDIFRGDDIRDGFKDVTHN
ncbi:MAG: hypothetical protein K6A38_09010 [Lachnospiraceae bacterium]|nr:hypothetical protein [Lachnospiraceae bacterium]